MLVEKLRYAHLALFRVIATQHNAFRSGRVCGHSVRYGKYNMYNNEHSGPAFDEFLGIIGRRVRLRSFEHYRAGHHVELRGDAPRVNTTVVDSEQ